MGNKNRTVEDMKKAHRVLSSFKFEPGGVNRGYTDRALYINLSENKIESKSIPEEVKDRFTGGRGYGLWYLWNAVSGNTKWSDPENEIIMCTGPICGITQYAGVARLMWSAYLQKLAASMTITVAVILPPFSSSLAGTSWKFKGRLRKM